MACRSKRKLSELKLIEKYLQKIFPRRVKDPSYIDSFSLVIGLGRGFKSLILDLLYYLPGIDIAQCMNFLDLF